MAKKPVPKRTKAAPRLTADQQWEKWRIDIERIYKETVYVFENRHVFREISQMFIDNANLGASGGFVYRWLHGMYGRDMVLAVGRELDKSTEVVNLIQLMYQMSKRPRVISRRRYSALFHRDSVIDGEMQAEQFMKLAGAADYMRVAVIRRDRNWLEKRCKRVMKYRHKMVAHRTTMVLSLSTRDIDKALDAIEVLLKKYYVLLTASALEGAEPAIQFDWKKPFNIAWLPRKS